jgi:hypothetical protein
MSWWWGGSSGLSAGIAARLGLKASVKTQVDAGVSHIAGLRTSIVIEKDSAVALTAPAAISTSVVTAVTPPPLPPDVVVGSYMRFASDDAALVVPSSSGFDPIGDLELRFSIRRLTSPTVDMIYDRSNPGTTDRQFLVQIDNANRFLVLVADSGVDRPSFFFNPGPPIDYGKWRDYRLQIDVNDGGNTTVSLYYRNGREDLEDNTGWALLDSISDTGTNTWATNTHDLYIGSTGGSPLANNFQGDMRRMVAYHSLTQTAKYLDIDFRDPRGARPKHSLYDQWMEQAGGSIASMQGIQGTDWFYDYRPIEFARSDYLEQLEGDQLFRGINLVTPEHWLTLYATNPTDADTGTEISAPSYSRVRVFADTVTVPYWAARQQERYRNAQRVQFPVAEETWGDIEWLGIRDASSGGNLLFHAPIPKISVGANAIVEFDINDLAVELR